MNGFLMFTTRPRPAFSTELWESLAVRYKRPKLPLTVAQVNKLRTEWFATARASASMMAKHVREVRKDLEAAGKSGTSTAKAKTKTASKRKAKERETPTARQTEVYSKYLKLGSMEETAKYFGISKPAVSKLVNRAREVLNKAGRSVRARRKLPADRRGQSTIPER